MKILITGADGQLGQAFRKIAPYTATELILLGRAELDITSPVSIAEACERYNPDVLVNSAAYTAVDKAEAEQLLADKVNHLGVACLAQVCRDRSLPLLQVSTDYVFSGTATRAYQPTDPVQPLGSYGLSKWRGEEVLRNLHSQHLIVRTAWVFSEFGNNFLKTMLRLGRERDILNVVADQQGCPTYAPHLAAGLIAMAEQCLQNGFARWGTYHFAGMPSTTWHGFACAIFQQAISKGVLARGPQVNAITTAQFPTPAPRPVFSVLDCSSTEMVFGSLERYWHVGIGAALSGISE